MPTPLVVFISADERDALCNGGVLPPAWFRNVSGLSSEWDRDESCVRLWTDELVYDAEYDGNIPPHPARLLGLEKLGSSIFTNEGLVAKFFGTWMLHVVFLDEDRNLSKIGVEPILKVARWAKAFDEAVEHHFSKEQVRNIKHGVIVIVRGSGKVWLTQQQLDLLKKEISDGGALQTCYFLDFRLETELGNDALHSKFLWPVMVGRLLLRLLIALSGSGEDDILLPGVHLWRSFEFLFDYPVKEMSKMLTQALDKAFRRLSEETDGSAAPDDAGQRISFGCGVNKADIFPGLSTSLTGLSKAETDPKTCDWHLYDSVAVTEELTNNDEERWGYRLNLAREEFADQEIYLFREGNPDKFSQNQVFSSVASDPHNISTFMKQMKEEKPSDTFSEEEVFEQWKKVVEAEEQRKAEQIRLHKASEELSLAQSHYVTAPYGIVAAISVALFCGYTIFMVLKSISDNYLLPAFVFSALSVAGAFAAWGLMTLFHRRAGNKAVEQFKGIAQKINDAMDERHGAAVATVRVAELQHRKRLYQDAWEALYRLLERNWRILSYELQSPTLSAFYRSEDGENAQPAPTPEELENLHQRTIFLKRTRFVESLSDVSLVCGNHECSDKVLRDALEEKQLESFHYFWHQTCRSVDSWQRGNLPAKILVPKIRRWLAGLCDRLSAAQKTDLLIARGRNPLPAGFESIRNDSGYVLASAHVDDNEVKKNSFHVFVFDETACSGTTRGVAGRAEEIIGGSFQDIPVIATPILNGLPQVAFYFQDIRLYGFDLAKDGSLAFKEKGGNA